MSVGLSTAMIGFPFLSLLQHSKKEVLYQETVCREAESRIKFRQKTAKIKKNICIMSVLKKQHKLSRESVEICVIRVRKNSKL